jgi:hypothetical protein
MKSVPYLMVTKTEEKLAFGYLFYVLSGNICQQQDLTCSKLHLSTPEVPIPIFIATKKCIEAQVERRNHTLEVLPEKWNCPPFPALTKVNFTLRIQ